MSTLAAQNVALFCVLAGIMWLYVELKLSSVRQKTECGLAPRMNGDGTSACLYDMV